MPFLHTFDNKKFIFIYFQNFKLIFVFTEKIIKSIVLFYNKNKDHNIFQNVDINSPTVRTLSGRLILE